MKVQTLLFQVAVEYERVVNLLCRDLLERQSGLVAMLSPGNVNAAFAVELYLKCLLLIEGKEPDRTHELVRLFDSLSGSTQRELQRVYDVYKRTLRTELARAANAFERWRYMHEWYGQEERREPGGEEPVSQVVRELEDDGRVVFLGQKTGFAVRGIVPDRVTLVELYRLALERTDPDHQDEEGRTGDNFRKVDVVTEDQLKDIRTAVGKIADYLGDGDVAAVGSEHFGKDLAAGDWRIIADFRAWLDRTGVSSSYRSKLVGAVRNLLNLAATHSLIEGHGCHIEDHEVYAAEWHGHVEAWIADVLQENGGSSPGKVKRGVRILALYATRRHELSPSQVKWKALREDFEDDIEERIAERPDDEARLRRLYGAVRYVWRHTPRLQEEWPWTIERDRRVGLVPNRALRAVVDNPNERDFSRFGFHHETLFGA